MKLGIYMGSFNPVHKGHIKVINHLLNYHYVDKVLVVPTINYWDKQDLIDIKHRINMLKLYENDDIMIDTKHNQYIYTYELVKEIKKIYNNDELYLIIGADNILHFDKWKNYQELLKMQILVIKRDGINIYDYIKKLKANNFIIVDDFQEINISSTKIRKNLDHSLLDKKVLDYIENNHLYEGENNVQDK